MSDLVFEAESFAVRGACFEVYKDEECGFREPVYHECLEVELGISRIPFRSQARLSLEYKGRSLKSVYSPDFICYESMIVELKALSHLCDEHRAQVHNYLKASGLRLGLLVNFGHDPKIEIERIIR
jgi:GxxExxY protein